MIRVVFKARIGDGPEQKVGGYEMSDDEWEEELSDFDGSEEYWLGSRGADWAYAAVHSDNLDYWVEIERDVE